MSAGEPCSVVVVGAGFAGIGMGAALRREGIEDFTILEQAGRVGGTWRDNHYPGAACDVESHLYSFSFAPNPRWSRTFAPQAEILDYLEDCADRFGLRPHLRLNTRVVGARFDDAAGLWEVETGDGRVRRARVLVAGCGGLSRPALPELPGLGTFAGPTFHSARWDHGVRLAGKRVALVGTGASAIQIVPAIAPEVGRLHVHQRTAPWILPKPDRPLTERERAIFRRAPVMQQLARLAQYWRHELFAVGFVVDTRIMRLGEHLARRHMEASVADRELRAKLRPGFTFGCKRVLLSNDYYPAL
jgi:cation diffusion facilitator CzcD-associated flavoprotein CzcO